MSNSSARIKKREGTVVSASMNKSIVVEFIKRKKHPKFKKLVKQSKHFYVHDEEGKAKVGDKVLIEETKPISKLKCWQLVKVIS